MPPTLAGDRLRGRLVGAVVDRHLRAGARRAPVRSPLRSPRASGDEGDLALERRRRRSDGREPSPAAFGATRGRRPRPSRSERSHRRRRPLRTWPGPISTNVVDALGDQLAHGLRELHRPRQLLDEEVDDALRRPRSRAVTVDMNGVAGSRKRHRLERRAQARRPRPRRAELWNAPLTRSFTVLRARASGGRSSSSSSTAAFSPETTIWPGQL